MQKRGGSIYVFLAAIVVAISLLISLSIVAAAESNTTPSAVRANASAQATTSPTNADAKAKDTSTSTGASSNTNVDAKLEIGAGITPDSALYGLVEKGILEKFRNDVENREKKIAEVREMIQEKKYDDARIALARYKEFADKLEREVAPKDKEEAQRSANAIRNAIKEIESQIPADQKKEFVEDIKAQEGRIEKAADVASKIKELCETLATLDPEQYARTCKTNKEAPQWQQDLDEKLTDEQKREAEAFFKIMSACFEDPKTCQCSQIKIQKFSEACSQIAPLAAKCQEGDEDACEKMDEVEDPMDYLPPHLQAAMAKVERRYSDDKFEHVGPPECKKAGATTREACMKVMFKKHAPEECVKAADEGKIDFTSERSMRESCEKLMFLANAPEECIKAGLKDHRKCGELMCETNLPDECKAAGLGCGNGRPDKIMRECEQLMRAQHEGKGGPNGGPGRGFAFGKNCNAIQDKDEKLKCFEEVFNAAQQGGFIGRGPEERFEGEGEHGGRGDSGSGQGFDYRSKPNVGFPEECKRAGIDGRNADDGERCNKLMSEQGGQRHQDTQRYQDDFARDCSARGGAWDCSNAGSSGGPCRCKYPENREYQRPPEGFRPPEGSQQPPAQTTQPTSPPPTGDQSSGTPTTTSPTPTTTSPTGSVITGNAFLDYYFRK